MARLPTGSPSAARSSTVGSIQPAWSIRDEARSPRRRMLSVNDSGEPSRRAHDPRRGERALAAASDEQPLVGEQLDRLADGHAAHVEALAQLGLGGQAVAGGGDRDQVAEVVRDLEIARGGLDGHRDTG